MDDPDDWLAQKISDKIEEEALRDFCGYVAYKHALRYPHLKAPSHLEPEKGSLGNPKRAGELIGNWATEETEMKASEADAKSEDDVALLASGAFQATTIQSKKIVR